MRVPASPGHRKSGALSALEFDRYSTNPKTHVPDDFALKTYPRIARIDTNNRQIISASFLFALLRCLPAVAGDSRAVRDLAEAETINILVFARHIELQSDDCVALPDKIITGPSYHGFSTIEHAIELKSLIQSIVGAVLRHSVNSCG